MMIDFKKELAEKTAAIDTIVNSYLPEASGEAEYIKSAMDYSQTVLLDRIHFQPHHPRSYEEDHGLRIRM